MKKSGLEKFLKREGRRTDSLPVWNPTKRAATEGTKLHPKKVRLDGGLGIRSFQRARRQTSGKGGAPIVLSLPPGNESSRPCLHPLRTVIAKVHGKGSRNQAVFWFLTPLLPAESAKA
jgi:hypothetical protein